MKPKTNGSEKEFFWIPQHPNGGFVFRQHLKEYSLRETISELSFDSRKECWDWIDSHLKDKKEFKKCFPTRVQVRVLWKLVEDK
jgi:hypothetical protein